MSKPTCGTHKINHGSNEPCPDCKPGSYRGMQTPMVKVGDIVRVRVNGNEQTPSLGEGNQPISHHRNQR